MKVLLQLKSTNGIQLINVPMEKKSADSYTGKARKEFGCPVAGVSGELHLSVVPLKLAFNLVSDTPITYKSDLSFDGGSFKCKVTIYQNQSRVKPYAVVTECSFKAGGK